MNKKKDIVDKAVEALKNEPVPHGPPQEAVDAVITKLAEAGGVPPPRTIKQRIGAISLNRIAAAAVVLIMAGFAVGRLTSPRPPDMQELHSALETSLKASLEPAIQENLLEELKKYWQIAWAASHIRLKDELNQQLRQEMNRAGLQILAASGAVTNQRLAELTEAINAAQTQERRWIAAALEQIELNRRQDSSDLRSDLATFAVRTGDELLRTKQDLARWMAYTLPDKYVPNEQKNLNNSNERDKK